MKPKPWPRGLDYVIALAVIAVALLLRWPLYPLLDDRRPYLTLFGAVAFIVWLCRWRPATFAALVGFLAANYFLAEPRGSFAFNSFLLMEFVGYALSAGFIIFFGEVMHRAKERAEREPSERQKAEQSERRQKELLRVTLASVGDAVITTDAEARITFLNAVAEDVTGWKQGDAIGTPLDTVFRIVNEKTRNTVDNPALKALREGVIVGLANHTVLIAKDGTERAIDDSAAPINDAEGHSIGAVLVFRDVTERRKEERAVRWLASIVESSDDAIIGKDMNGAITSWNQAAERIFGYSAREAIGSPIAMLEPPERSGEMAEILARLKQGERIDHFDTLRRAKDGRLVPISLTVSPIYDEDGEIAGASKTARDISERKRADAALREERARLYAILSGMGDALVVTDAESRITIMNPVAQSLTGWKDEALGRPLEEVFRIANEESGMAVENPAIRALQEGVIVGLANHTVLITKDGTKRPIDDSAAPIKDAEGRVLGCVLIFRDITERRRSENILRDADRRKDEFLAMLAHELRNPLAPIRNAVRILFFKGQPDPDLRWCREVIDRQVQHMAHLLDDLLDVSRISHDKLVLRKERIALATVLESAMETIRPFAEELQHQVSVTLPPEPIDVQGDAVRLSQVFGNLINNACKYTSPGGHIWVTTQRQGSDVLVSVKDNGVGISPEMLPRIFEMFTQVDQSLERAQGGLGIGLTLVKELVELHGGTVEALSDGPGLGSEFVVRLPIVIASQEHRSRPTPTVEQRQTVTPHRILVVDDNRDSAWSLAMLLKVNGHETRLAHDGLEAVAVAEDFLPQVVLLDIGLPKLNGFDACRRIREQPWGRSMVLVALTGWGQEEDRLKSKDAGFDHHMIKPVDYGALESLLGEMKSAPT